MILSKLMHILLTTAKHINMNTMEEYLKCRLYHFSLSFDTKSYMIYSAQLSIVLNNMCRVFQGYLFIYKKIKFRKFSLMINTLTLNTETLNMFK